MYAMEQRIFYANTALFMEFQYNFVFLAECIATVGSSERLDALLSTTLKPNHTDAETKIRTYFSAVIQTNVTLSHVVVLNSSRRSFIFRVKQTVGTAST